MDGGAARGRASTAAVFIPDSDEKEGGGRSTGRKRSSSSSSSSSSSTSTSSRGIARSRLSLGKKAARKDHELPAAAAPWTGGRLPSARLEAALADAIRASLDGCGLEYDAAEVAALTARVPRRVSDLKGADRWPSSKVKRHGEALVGAVERFLEDHAAELARGGHHNSPPQALVDAGAAAAASPGGSAARVAAASAAAEGRTGSAIEARARARELAARERARRRDASLPLDDADLRPSAASRAQRPVFVAVAVPADQAEVLDGLSRRLFSAVSSLVADPGTPGRRGGSLYSAAQPLGDEDAARAAVGREAAFLAEFNTGATAGRRPGEDPLEFLPDDTDPALCGEGANRAAAFRPLLEVLLAYVAPLDTVPSATSRCGTSAAASVHGAPVANGGGRGGAGHMSDDDDLGDEEVGGAASCAVITSDASPKRLPPHVVASAWGLLRIVLQRCGPSIFDLMFETRPSGSTGKPFAEPTSTCPAADEPLSISALTPADPLPTAWEEFEDDDEGAGDVRFGSAVLTRRECDDLWASLGQDLWDGAAMRDGLVALAPRPPPLAAWAAARPPATLAPDSPASRPALSSGGAEAGPAAAPPLADLALALRSAVLAVLRRPADAPGPAVVQAALEVVLLATSRGDGDDGGGRGVTFWTELVDPSDGVNLGALLAGPAANHEAPGGDNPSPDPASAEGLASEAAAAAAAAAVAAAAADPRSEAIARAVSMHASSCEVAQGAALRALEEAAWAGAAAASAAVDDVGRGGVLRGLLGAGAVVPGGVLGGPEGEILALRALAALLRSPPLFALATRPPAHAVPLRPAASVAGLDPTAAAAASTAAATAARHTAELRRQGSVGTGEGAGAGAASTIATIAARAFDAAVVERAPLPLVATVVRLMVRRSADAAEAGAGGDGAGPGVHGAYDPEAVEGELLGWAAACHAVCRAGVHVVTFARKSGPEEIFFASGEGGEGIQVGILLDLLAVLKATFSCLRDRVNFNFSVPRYAWGEYTLGHGLLFLAFLIESACTLHVFGGPRISGLQVDCDLGSNRGPLQHPARYLRSLHAATAAVAAGGHPAASSDASSGGSSSGSGGGSGPGSAPIQAPGETAAAALAVLRLRGPADGPLLALRLSLVALAVEATLLLVTLAEVLEESWEYSLAEALRQHPSDRAALRVLAADMRAYGFGNGDASSLGGGGGDRGGGDDDDEGGEGGSGGCEKHDFVLIESDLAWLQQMVSDGEAAAGESQEEELVGRRHARGGESLDLPGSFSDDADE